MRTSTKPLQFQIFVPIMNFKGPVLHSLLVSLCAGVSLVCGLDGGVSVASVPSVLVQREASERRRGRPSVALDLVQVSGW